LEVVLRIEAEDDLSPILTFQSNFHLRGKALPQFVLDRQHMCGLLGNFPVAAVLAGRGLWIALLLLGQLLSRVDRKALGDDLLAQRLLPLAILDALQNLGMPERDLLDTPRLLHRRGQVEETNQIADRGSVEAEALGQLFLRQAEPVEI